MDLTTIGKNLIFIGIFIVLTGGAFFSLGKLGINNLKIPGDIFIQKEQFTFYFPLASCLIFSILLTLILNIFSKK